MNIVKLLVPAVLITLSGCSWVDSTGNQDTSATAVVDSTLVLLNPNDAFSIRENTQRTIVFNGPESRVSNWSWDLLEGQGNAEQCRGIDGFDEGIASNALSQTCADGNNCKINVEEVVLDNVTRFSVTTPHMRAPAALAFRFSATTDTGVYIEQRQTMCAIAINDAPVPADDPVSVMRGTVLQVNGGDKQSLLYNDTDDVDVRNQPLRIDPTPVIAPRFARRFQMYSDGGFLYEPLSSAPISSNGSVSDSFTYSVTDGNESRTATVSIKISDFNSAPVMSQLIPDIEVEVSDTDRFPEIAYLQSYFRDAENDALVFTVLDSSLPQSGNIYLTDDGVLEGFATENDSGLYVVSVAVSDSIESIEASFFLNVVHGNGRNKAPSVTDINNKTVTGDFSYNVGQFFTDRDDDYLYYTAIHLPDGVEITSDGFIVGTSSSANRGTWLIRVTADDGNGGTVDDGFRLRIQ